MVVRSNIAPVGVTDGYPAAEADFLTLVGPEYFDSMWAGVAATTTLLEQLDRRCGPTTRFVLGGFSEGAEVVTHALVSLPASLRTRIDGVELIASPIFDGDLRTLGISMTSRASGVTTAALRAVRTRFVSVRHRGRVGDPQDHPGVQAHGRGV